MTDETTGGPELDEPQADAVASVEPTSDAPMSGVETTEAVAARDDAPRGRRRGSLAIYGIAFGLLVTAAVCLVVGAVGILGVVNVAETSFFGTQRILRASAVISGLSIVAAVVALVVPRRSS